MHTAVLSEVAPPTEVFAEEDHEIQLGGTAVKLIHLPIDLVWPYQLPPPGVPDMAFAGVRRATEKMLALDFERLIPGHGDLGTKADVAAYGTF